MSTPDPIHAAAMECALKLLQDVRDLWYDRRPNDSAKTLERNFVGKIATAMRELVAEKDAENARLRERVAELDAKNMAYHKACIYLDKFVPFFGVDNCERIKSVATQLTAARRDAERLDWLSTRVYMPDDHPQRGIALIMGTDVVPHGGFSLEAENYREIARAAIDAAMQREDGK
jgi:hypothetical protein